MTALPGPMPTWYSTLWEITNDEVVPKPVREAVVEVLAAYGALRLDRRELYTERGRMIAMITAVRRLCESLQVEDVNGGRTDADTLWPSEVLDLLSPPVEAGATEPAPAVRCDWCGWRGALDD
jgi:hypothetical protein